MARWKANSDGSPYYDANDDSNVNQVAVPTGYNNDGTQQQASQPQQGAPANPYPTTGEQPEAQTQTQWGDVSKPPSYPYLMNGQEGWPDLSQYHQQPMKDNFDGTDGSGASAPANNPDAAPEQGYYGSGMGDFLQMMKYTPEQGTFDEAFKNYWAPDRAQKLASLRYGANQPAWTPDFQGDDGRRYFRDPTSNPGDLRNADGSPITPYGSSPTPPVAPPSTGTAPAAPAAGPPQGGYAFMEGVDTRKMNDQTHTSPKYVASRILASGGSLQDAAKAIGATVLGPDTMRLSTGETIDTRRDIEGANQLQWTVTNDPNDPNWGKPAVSGGGTSGVNGLTGGSGASGTSGSGSGSFGSSSFSSSGAPGYDNFGAKGNTLWDMLMGRAQQSLQMGAKDPIIANQVNSYRAEQTRGVRDQLAQAAEAQGPTANLNMERRMANEKASQATGGLQASLMQNELGARRQEIQQALSQMGSMLSDEQRTALTRELGLINSGIDQQRVNNQNNQFLDDLGLRATDRANYWDSLRSGLING